MRNINFIKGFLPACIFIIASHTNIIAQDKIVKHEHESMLNKADASIGTRKEIFLIKVNELKRLLEQKNVNEAIAKLGEVRGIMNADALAYEEAVQTSRKNNDKSKELKLEDTMKEKRKLNSEIVALSADMVGNKIELTNKLLSYANIIL